MIYIYFKSSQSFQNTVTFASLGDGSSMLCGGILPPMVYWSQTISSYFNLPQINCEVIKPVDFQQDYVLKMKFKTGIRK